MNNKQKNGKVYLVGAGPGDPDLISIKGMNCIKRADVVIYDYLAAPALLAYASDKAEMIYVGKKGGDHTLAQEGINTLIVKKALEGLTVTRLKGGDPFIFGRGGEEALELIKAGVSFEIVPGITSAIAVPAYAGIPLTHRDFTSTLAFVTGHEDPLKETSSIDWDALSKGIGTIIFFMGVKNLPEITRKLIDHGKPKDTPVALIRWGTTPQQKTVTGTLETIVDNVKAAGLKPPCIIVVGQVVTLRKSMKWFENRPLFGKQIVITRARAQASDLISKLSDLGAHCLEFPTIDIIAPAHNAVLDQAIDNITSYHWIVFTSVNGVTYFFKRLYEKGYDTRKLGHLKTASIGPATRDRLLTYGLNSDIIPDSYRAESVVEAFKNESINGKKILLPRAKDARPVLPVELTKMGAVVDEVTTYTAETVKHDTGYLISELENNSIDLVTFTSSSTVKNFKALLPDEKFNRLLKNVTIASIGPITTDTAQSLGFHVDITADTYTIDGLCDAILKYYEKQSKNN